MELFDSHCHLDLPAFDPDRDAILAHCRRIGLNNIVIPGVTRERWGRLLTLCAQHRTMLHPALGLHPLFVEQHNESQLTELAEQIRRHRPVAVGEIGLDYYVDQPDRKRQLHYFEAQLEIATDAGLPVILHIRKAHDIALSCLRRKNVPGGVVHAFNGSLQQAEQYLALGFRLGFGGTVTHSGAHRLRRLVRQLPLHALLLETDAPDMPPAGHHGERNRPDYLPEILQSIAELCDEEPLRIARQTTLAARKLFALPDPLLPAPT